jgi:hypothetical protein
MVEPSMALHESVDETIAGMWPWGAFVLLLLSSRPSSMFELQAVPMLGGVQSAQATSRVRPMWAASTTSCIVFCQVCIPQITGGTCRAHALMPVEFARRPLGGDSIFLHWRLGGTIGDGTWSRYVQYRHTCHMSAEDLVCGMPRGAVVPIAEPRGSDGCEEKVGLAMRLEEAGDTWGRGVLHVLFAGDCGGLGLGLGTVR